RSSKARVCASRTSIRFSEMEGDCRMDLEEKVQLSFLSGAERFLFAQVQERSHMSLSGLLRPKADAGAAPHVSIDDIERIVQVQAGCGAQYFMRVAGRAFHAIHAEAIHNTILSDHRCHHLRRTTRLPTPLP